MFGNRQFFHILYGLTLFNDNDFSEFENFILKYNQTLEGFKIIIIFFRVIFILL